MKDASSFRVLMYFNGGLSPSQFDYVVDDPSGVLQSDALRPIPYKAFCPIAAS